MMTRQLVILLVTLLFTTLNAQQEINPDLSKTPQTHVRMTIMSTWSELGWDKNTSHETVSAEQRMAKFQEVVKNIANKLDVVHSEKRLNSFEVKSFEENECVVEFVELKDAEDVDLKRLSDRVMGLGKWFLKSVTRGDTEIAIRQNIKKEVVADTPSIYPQNRVEPLSGIKESEQRAQKAIKKAQDLRNGRESAINDLTDVKRQLRDMKKAEQALITEASHLQEVRKQITEEGQQILVDLEKKFARDLERALFKARQETQAKLRVQKKISTDIGNEMSTIRDAVATLKQKETEFTSQSKQRKD